MNKNGSPVIAVVLAGGRGVRFGADVPKQFIKLAGRMVIEHTIEIFDRVPAIDEILVVVPEGYRDLLWEVATRNGWRKVVKVVLGGGSRAESTASAIAALAEYPRSSRMLIHDAARPLLDQPTVYRCLEALNTYDAVDVVVPTADTIVRVNEEGLICDIPERSTLRRGQTPQAFRLGLLREAYSRASHEGLEAVTCDCGVIRREFPEVTIATVEGASSNLKITDGVDLFIAEKLIQIRSLQDAQDDAVLSSIAGRVVVVIGASYGIGASVAELAGNYGAVVYGAGRSNGVDITSRSDIEHFLSQVKVREGRIDVVINTAGLLIHKPLGMLKEKEIDEVVGVNLTGAINLAQVAYPYLKESQGCLINFTSSSYTRGRAFYAAYSATKAGVVNLTQALAEEWAADGIRVLCINPERTRTPMRISNFGAEPVETLLDPLDVARATLRALASSFTGMIYDIRRTLKK